MKIRSAFAASLLAAVSLGFSAQSFAFETQVMTVNDELIKEVHLTKIAEEEFVNVNPLGWESDCTLLDKKKTEAMSDVDLTDIVNLGKKVWQIVKDNEPILEARGLTASALPRGIECWNELANWSPTRAETYHVKYVNLYGMTVVNFQFRLLYSYGGQYKSQGRYLTNATIQYSNVEVLWGYIFNADVEIPQVLNMGTENSPLAGMQMTMNWAIKTRPISLKKSVNSASFFVAGDGRATRVLD